MLTNTPKPERSRIFSAMPSNSTMASNDVVISVNTNLNNTEEGNHVMGKTRGNDNSAAQKTATPRQDRINRYIKISDLDLKPDGSVPFQNAILVPDRYLIIKNLNTDRYNGIRKIEGLKIECLQDPTLANRPTPKSQPRFGLQKDKTRHPNTKFSIN